MTSRELRKQRREAERKAKKLEYKQNRIAAASAQGTSGAGSLAGKPVAEPALTPGGQSSSAFAPNPDLLDEFSADEQAEMMALRARVHARVGLTAPSEPVAIPPSAKPGPTGPRTATGKAISSGNSLKHGLASGRIIVPGEDPADFETLLNDLIVEHAPANETETLLVQHMAQSWWLMQRAIRIQNQAFAETRIDTHKLALFLRYQTAHERAFYKALNTLTKLNQNRARQQAAFRANGARQHAVSEFVSQSRPSPQPRNEFVSQKTTIAATSSPSGEVQSGAAPPLRQRAG